MRKLLLSILVLLLIPSTVFADAASTRQERDAAHAYIQGQVNTINQLSQEKKLGEALDLLDDLNRYIESNLAPVFYDRVPEVRREYTGYSYTPPVVSVSLGEAFIAAFWDAKIAQAEKSLTDAMKGVASMRVLNNLDRTWSYLKGAYDTINSLKDIIEDLATMNLVKLAYDFDEGANGFYMKHRHR